jgi:hypothetical protein
VTRELLFIELAANGIVVAGFALRRLLEARKRARGVLEESWETPIRALTDGTWARVTGTVSPLRPLQPSPIDQRSCIGYRSVIGRSRGGSSNGFEHMLARESCPPFSIADETGTAVVEGPFIIALDVDDSSWTQLPPGVFKLLDEAGIPSGLPNLRFSEAFLLPGDRVTVVGNVSITIDPTGEPSGFREPPILRRIIGTDLASVVLRDAVDESGAPGRPFG